MGQGQARLEADPEKLRSLEEMEKTGGEPDVVGQDKKTGKLEIGVSVSTRHQPIDRPDEMWTNINIEFY